MEQFRITRKSQGLQTDTQTTPKPNQYQNEYYDLTKKQLDDWGVKYTDLQVGNKPHFDMYICDKSYNSETYFHRVGQGLP